MSGCGVTRSFKNHEEESEDPMTGAARSTKNPRVYDACGTGDPWDMQALPMSEIDCVQLLKMLEAGGYTRVLEDRLRRWLLTRCWPSRDQLVPRISRRRSSGPRPE